MIPTSRVWSTSLTRRARAPRYAEEMNIFTNQSGTVSIGDPVMDMTQFKIPELGEMKLQAGALIESKGDVNLSDYTPPPYLLSMLRKKMNSQNGFM